MQSVVKLAAEILTKPEAQRTLQDLKLLTPLLSEISYFKNSKLKEQDLCEIVQCLKFKKSLPETYEMRYGEPGDTFYIIIEGKCSVWVPIMPEMMESVIAELSKVKLNTPTFSFNFRDSDDKWYSPEHFYKLYPDRKFEPGTTTEISYDQQLRKFNEQKFKIFKAIMSKVSSRRRSSAIDPDLVAEAGKMYAQDSEEAEESNKNGIEPCDNMWGFKTAKLIQPNKPPVVKQQDLNLNNKLPMHVIGFQGQLFEYWNGSYYKQVALLGPGQSMGELALIDKKNLRMATVKCDTKVCFVTLDSQQFKKSLMNLENKKLNKVIDFLVGIPLFQTVSRKTVTKMAQFLTKRTFKRQQVVYQAGQPSKYLYIVLKGEFEMVRPSSQSLQQRMPEVNYFPKELRMILFGPGSVVGEEDLLHDQYHSSLKCYSQKGKVYEFQKEHFKLFQTNLPLRLQLLQSVIQKEQQIHYSHIGKPSKSVQPQPQSQTKPVIQQPPRVPTPNPQQKEPVVFQNIELQSALPLKSVSLKRTEAPPKSAQPQVRIRRKLLCQPQTARIVMSDLLSTQQTSRIKQANTLRKDFRVKMQLQIQDPAPSSTKSKTLQVHQQMTRLSAGLGTQNVRLRNQLKDILTQFARD